MRVEKPTSQIPYIQAAIDKHIIYNKIEVPDKFSTKNMRDSLLGNDVHKSLLGIFIVLS